MLSTMNFKGVPTSEIDKSSIYIGKVIDNKDPEKLGRCRIRIEELHGTVNNIPDDKLPWALQLKSTGLGSGKNKSFHMIPDIDTLVSVIYPKSDIYSPYYTSAPNVSGTENSNLFNALSYDKSYGFSDGVNSIKIDRILNSLEVSLDGSLSFKVLDRLIEIGNTGTITIKSGIATVEVSTVEIKLQNGFTSMTMGALGNLNIQGDVNITGSVTCSGVSISPGIGETSSEIESSTPINISAPQVNIQQG